MSDYGDDDLGQVEVYDDVDEDFFEIEEEDPTEETDDIYDVKDTIDKIKEKTSKLIPRSDRKTSSIMTIYEKTRLLGIRTQQIDMGCDPLIDDTKDFTDSLQIAEQELKIKKLPLIIRRYLPNGDYEDWEVDEMVIP
jgi:DNA-directed RNA polymerase I, II, and III subunit RPABC2